MIHICGFGRERVGKRRQIGHEEPETEAKAAQDQDADDQGSPEEPHHLGQGMGSQPGRRGGEQQDAHPGSPPGDTPRGDSAEPPKDRRGHRPDPWSFTPREAEALRLRESGLPYRDIARFMGITPDRTMRLVAKARWVLLNRHYASSRVPTLV